MPKKTLWFIAVAIAGLVYVTWDAGRIPARVTVMNQSASPVQDAVLITDSARLELGALRSGESRALSVEPTNQLILTYHWQGQDRRWNSLQPLAAGQPLALYVTSTGRVTPRSRLGTIER